MDNQKNIQLNVKSFPTIETQDTTIYSQNGCRSMTLINKGTSTCTLWGVLPLAPTEGITLSGYTNAFRLDEIQINFGAGTNLLVVIRDMQHNISEQPKDC